MNLVAFNMKRIIKEKGYQINYVAEKTGYKHKAFSNMINGKRGIKDIDIYKLSQFLGVTPSDFFEEIK